jgi:hypothetical protein
MTFLSKIKLHIYEHIVSFRTFKRFKNLVNQNDKKVASYTKLTTTIKIGWSHI